MPNDQVRVLRPCDIVAEEDKESEEIYEPAGWKFYMAQPKTDVFEKMLYPDYL